MSSHKIWHVVMYEPLGAKLETYFEFSPKFKEVGWFHFCEKLQGYHIAVAWNFVKGFDGTRVTIGYLTFLVSKNSITITGELP